MGEFEHKDKNGVRHQLGDVFRDPPSLLHRLIQRKVVAFRVTDSFFTLNFDDGQELAFNGSGLGENGLIQLSSDPTDGWVDF